MIRQICDGRGSFVKATKAFAEFKDVVVWASFSLSSFGYPRLPLRLLRHFNLVRCIYPSTQRIHQRIPVLTCFCI